MNHSLLLDKVLEHCFSFLSAHFYIINVKIARYTFPMSWAHNLFRKSQEVEE